MMARKSGLGRGLDALIPGSPSTAQNATLAIPLDRIIPNPNQPRENFDPAALAELATSIREHGIIQPLVVTHDAETDLYTLIAGERRLLAARQAGLRAVPAIVREATPQERLELALIENLQRADLNPLEAAEAYRQLSESFNLSHEEISGRVGKSRTAITNTLRLLRLPPAVKQALVEGKITEGHARALLALPTPQAQASLLNAIVARDLSVRQTEELVRKLSGYKPDPETKPALPPEYSALEERLRSRLGTRVSINRRRKGGSLVIHYFSDEELNHLIDILLGDSPGD